MHLYIAGDVRTMMANGYHMKSGGLERAMAQLVLALHHMHSKSIMHRDIKLDNVYISESGFVVCASQGRVLLAVACAQTSSNFNQTDSRSVPPSVALIRCACNQFEVWVRVMSRSRATLG